MSQVQAKNQEVNAYKCIYVVLLIVLPSKMKGLDATRRRRNHMKHLNGPSQDELQKFLQARSK